MLYTLRSSGTVFLRFVPKSNWHSRDTARLSHSICSNLIPRQLQGPLQLQQRWRRRRRRTSSRARRPDLTPFPRFKRSRPYSRPATYRELRLPREIILHPLTLSARPTHPRPAGVGSSRQMHRRRAFYFNAQLAGVLRRRGLSSLKKSPPRVSRPPEAQLARARSRSSFGNSPLARSGAPPVIYPVKSAVFNDMRNEWSPENATDSFAHLSAVFFQS